MKKCRFCAEAIQDEAVVCRHCGKPAVSTEIEALARRWGTMKQMQRDAEWAGLSEADQAQLRGFLDVLSRESPPTVAKPEKSGVPAWRWGVSVVFVVLLLAAFCSTIDDPLPSSRSSMAVDETTPWTPSSFTGTGPQDTEDFYVGAREWTACYTLTSYSRLSDGRAVAVLYADVLDADGREMASLAGDAGTGSTHGCTVVRAAPGRFYWHVNVGGGVGWRVEARP